MKRETLHLPGGMSIETGKDTNGRFYVTYGRDTSVFLRCPKEVQHFLRLPSGTPSRASVDSWMASLAAADQEKGLSPDPA